MLTVLLIYVANCIITGNTQDFAVRLNNSFGNNSKEGRLEIYYSGRWGTVCKHGFTNVSARVACASLGFGYKGAEIGNRYGAGTGPIWLDNINCNGYETGIEQCVHNAWSVNNCSHGEDVSISCDCISRTFSGFSGMTGKISSPNFPMVYANYLDCYNYVTVPTGQKIIITFLTFTTEPSSDWLTINCTSGITYTSPRYSGSQIPGVLTISSCNQVNVYFHTDGSVTNTGFNLTYTITSDCADRFFSGPTGQISSPNFPMAYNNNQDCSSYITVPSGQTTIITFLEFNTEYNYDWVTIACESGDTFRTPRYWGLDFPAVLTISSCNRVNVHFHTDGSVTNPGFNLTYNITSDTVKGGITTKPSNALPRLDKNDPIIFNCTTTTKYLPWWTVDDKSPRNYTITNSTCGVITSASYSSLFRTETLGPGSCNLIVTGPGYNLSLVAGSLVCTDSTLASARAILAPINLELKLTKGVNSSTTVTDIIRDEQVRISCNPSFTDQSLSSSLALTYFLYSGGPLVRMRILGTYWTSEGNVISSNGTSNASSYVVVKAPVGVIPRYTCNIICDFFSNISDISGDSSIEISFSTDPVDVLYWPTEDNMRIIGDNNGQIRTPTLLYCNVAANPPATYRWIDESNDNTTNGPTIMINQGGRYTCNASNIIRGQYYQQSKSVNLQVLEDDTDRLKLMAIILGALLGAAVLTIIIILAIVLCCKCRQKPSTASDVCHINHGNEQELHQRPGRSNSYEAGFRNDVDLDKTEYVNLGGVSRRPVSIYPDHYEELGNQK